MNTSESLRYFLPETFLIAGAFLVLLFDLFSRNKKIVGALAILAVVGSAFLAQRPTASLSLFSGNFTLDEFTHFFRYLILFATAVSLLVSLAYKALPETYEGEFYSLFLFMAVALILLAASTNLLMIFISFEFVSILSYLFTGFLKKNAKSKEAAIKYLLFGSLASGVMLFGMSLLFGASGSLDLIVIQKTLSQPSYSPLLSVSLLLFLAGLGFKIALAPFHMWAPDVYEAAPTPVAGFLTVGPKAVGFALLARILLVLFHWTLVRWQPLIFFISIFTMTLGNLTALSQTNIKRLLAYSTIAQAGYILMGIASVSSLGVSAVLVYLAAYTFTNLGAFACVTAISNVIGNDELQSYAGLSRRSPFLAACMTFFLLSLAGIPPTAGFIGKFYVFSAAIDSKLYFLAIAAAINSAVAAFYYFKIVRQMYLTAQVNEEPMHLAPSLALALVLLALGTLLLGLFPSPLIAFVQGIMPG